MQIENIINGQIREGARRTGFQVWSLPETTAHDVEFALKVANAQSYDKAVPLPETTALLASIGRDQDWIEESHLVEIAQKSGSPIKYLHTTVQRFNRWLAHLDEYVTSLGHVNSAGQLVRGGLNWQGGLTSSLILAGDEATLAPWALTHALLAGSPGIAKPSSIEPLSAFLFLKAVIKRGGRTPALLAFDSTQEHDRAQIGRIIRHTNQSVVFGEDHTIASIYQPLPFLPAHKAIPYWSGRSGVIVYPDADVVQSARAIIAGATEDRGNRCISTKKVFAPRSMASTLEQHLVAEADKLVRGDPLDAHTDLGVNEPGARRRAEQVAAGADVFYTRDFLMARCDDHADLLCNEVPYPAVALRYYDDGEDPVALANLSVRNAPSGRALVISVFTESDKGFAQAASRLYARKVLRNLPTGYWDPVKTHQAIHLCLELMRPCEAM